jgi:hypothetical protein
LNSSAPFFANFSNNSINILTGRLTNPISFLNKTDYKKKDVVKPFIEMKKENLISISKNPLALYHKNKSKINNTPTSNSDSDVIRMDVMTTLDPEGRIPQKRTNPDGNNDRNTKPFH